MSERLQRVLDAHGLRCGALIASGGEIVERVGDFSGCSDGLVSALLGPYGSPSATFERVQDREVLRPQMWAQGDDFAFVDRAGDLVAVVFGRDRGNALAQYELSQLVGQSLAEGFGCGLTAAAADGPADRG